MHAIVSIAAPGDRWKCLKLDLHATSCPLRITGVCLRHIEALMQYIGRAAPLK